MNTYSKEIIIDIEKILNFVDDKKNFKKIEKKYIDYDSNNNFKLKSSFCSKQFNKGSIF